MLLRFLSILACGIVGVVLIVGGMGTAFIGPLTSFAHHPFLAFGELLLGTICAVIGIMLVVLSGATANGHLD